MTEASSPASVFHLSREGTEGRYDLRGRAVKCAHSAAFSCDIAGQYPALGARVAGATAPRSISPRSGLVGQEKAPSPNLVPKSTYIRAHRRLSGWTGRSR